MVQFFVCFDITGDIGFGKSFHCLDDVQYYEWMSFMLDTIKANYLCISLRHYLLLFRYLMWLIPESVKQQQQQQNHYRNAVDEANRCLELKVKRPDFISSMGSLLIIVDSETTGTVFAGITNHLLQAPTSLRRLSDELRSCFNEEKDLSFTALKRHQYLNAVINEGLRMCNPKLDARRTP
ncbi:uncharacterized protein A1O9_04375 [Exophiala aquamarina CBS 119918]|uniref:Cytochrome P450 oxidoreductase n=1 Tax=Exophiala aquamarina CBS 119918 TaxID=1182545 RepID=A0A072PI23_9EURO|nr:uncharacterized protein A1O9_04375 [Exophiala aquamarina CBS 119918]KEF59531.1 hypothetical protein A1O9_04375 [Exophiala aquamarina CBS 119918]